MSVTWNPLFAPRNVLIRTGATRAVAKMVIDCKVITQRAIVGHYSGRKIAPNTGANATKFFALATKSLKLVANLATRISNHTLIPRDLAIVEDLLRYKSAAKFLVKLVSKTQH